MDTLKKTGIVAGAVIGGVIGGGISLVGKLTRVKVVDDIGSSITSSSILTGEMAGKLVSGAADVASGALMKNPEKAGEGFSDLKFCGKQVTGNFVENIRYLTDSGSEIVSGVKAKDPGKAAGSVKKLAKWLAVGAITVGAIKMVDSDEDIGKE